MSEEETINWLQSYLEYPEMDNPEYIKQAIQSLINLYNKEKDKINSKIEEYEEILQSSIIKEDYKKEVEHIVRVLKELRGDN